jgi:hypothetical protein
MKEMQNENIATHQFPAWGDKANYILQADLSTYGMSGRFEQLWAKRIGEGEFTICCIPFFTYGIALGDTVLARDDDFFQRVMRKGGHRNLRVAIIHSRRAVRIHRVLDEWVKKVGALYEWLNQRYLAVDVTSRNKTLDLGLLRRMERGREIAFEIDE